MQENNTPAMSDVEYRIRRERIFLNNPVIMQGLGLAPVIVAATTAQNALLLSVAVLLLLTPTRVLGAVLGRFTPYRFRGPVYALSAAVVYVGMYWVVSHLFSGAEIALVGLYLPLLVMDPIILKRYERAQNERVDIAFKKGIVTALGYILVLFVMGSLREVLGAGTIFGAKILSGAPLPMAQLPAGGFGVLAVLMVLWRGFAGVLKRNLDPELEAKEWEKQ